MKEKSVEVQPPLTVVALNTAGAVTMVTSDGRRKKQAVGRDSNSPIFVLHCETCGEWIPVPGEDLCDSASAAALGAVVCGATHECIVIEAQGQGLPSTNVFTQNQTNAGANDTIGQVVEWLAGLDAKKDATIIKNFQRLMRITIPKSDEKKGNKN